MIPFNADATALLLTYRELVKQYFREYLGSFDLDAIRSCFAVCSEPSHQSFLYRIYTVVSMK